MKIEKLKFDINYYKKEASINNMIEYNKTKNNWHKTCRF